ncbi:hypothetical protein SCHPADRAFT_899546 [Schizopora paradoxa]|uniref:F-box domain-containing protein n=1 Tax=Schizopora paradoxa TaxID=27342 RepID=A0A0H2SAL4_9AGAM|nr:hypothetical protein SCHPADRAFT_899546 [Schizopora paradoxa]
MANLPPELWMKIFRFATLPEATFDSMKRVEAGVCANNDDPILRFLPDGRTYVEPYAQFKVKRVLSLVSQFFNQLVKEFLFEILFIANQATAETLADLVLGHDSGRQPGMRSWVRQIVIATPTRFSKDSCQRTTSAIIRIISKLHRLELFYLRWKTARNCEEQIVDALPPTIKHFEWHNPGGGFCNSPKRSLSQFLHGIRGNLKTLRVSGYLPLPGPLNNGDIREDAKCEFLSLKHLSVNREFYCDLHLISTWVLSDNLTCLSLGTFWSYPKTRDPQCSFFKTMLPSLRCLHLGKSARMSPKLLRVILDSATRLRRLDYAFSGDLVINNWENVQHHYLESVEIRLLFPWDLQAIGEHLRPFVVSAQQEDNHSLRFSSLRFLQFVTSPAHGGMQNDTRKLKEFIRMIMGTTSVSLEFPEDHHVPPLSPD